MKKYIFRSILILFIFLFSFFHKIDFVSAIGVSPSVVQVNNAMNNIEFKTSVSISRGNPSQEEFFTVTPIGDGAKYLKLPEGPFVLPKGQTSTRYDFSVYPIGAPNGDYEAALIFNSVDDPKKTALANGMAVSVGVRGKVVFTVTDKEVKNFLILNAYGQDTEVGQPAPFYYTMKNNGNVDSRPDKIAYEFVDEADTVHVYKGEISSSNLPTVSPGKMQQVLFNISEKFTPGRYRVNLGFYLGEILIGTSEGIIVNVFESGTLKQHAQFKNFQANKQIFEPGELISFSGTLVNNGEIAIQPIFQIQIEKGTKQIEKLSSLSKNILKGQGSSFELTYRPTENGKFEAKAYFEYGINKTEVKSVAFEVSKPNNILYIGMGVGFLLLLLIIVHFAKKFLSKDDMNDEDPGESQEIK